jgi:hypothetical protein
MLGADAPMIKSQALEDPCYSGTVPAGIDGARLEDDEHGYPRMNTDVECCFAEQTPKIRVHPLLLSVSIRVSLALFGPASMLQGLKMMNTDIQG